MKYEIDLDVENADMICVVKEYNASGIKLDYVSVKPLNEANIRKRWRANKGSRYCYVEGDGEVHYEIELYTSFDDMLYNFGNYFKTREEAEFESACQRVLNELKIYTNNNTEAGSSFWIIGYDRESNFIKTMVIYPLVPMSVPFTFKTKKDAEAAIHNIGEERLKKYFFRIKEN